MGKICHKEEKDDSPSTTIQISNLENFEGVNLVFTVDKISRIDTECLVIFTDKKLKVEQNQFLLRCGKAVAHKLQQFLDVMLIKQSLSPGQSLLMNVDIPEFLFSKVCIICLQVWGGNKQSIIENPLRGCLDYSWRKIKQAKIQRMGILQFNNEFGLPNNIANKILAESLIKQKIGFQTIILISKNDALMAEMKKQIIHYAQNFDKNSVDNSKQESVYY